MVISTMLTNFSINSKGKSSEKGKLGVHKSDIGIILTSWVSGFIVGPKNFSKKYRGDITSYALLTSNAGFGFVVSLVGVALWNNMQFGIYIFIVQLMISFFIFIVSKKDFRTLQVEDNVKKPFFNTVTNSVLLSTKTMLEICGFTIFFSIIKFTIKTIFCLDKKSNILSVISAMLEVSDGIFSVIKLENIFLCAFLTGFTIGFGGLCVCFQTFTIENINKKKFLICKLIQGIFLGLFTSLYVKKHKIEPLKIASLNVFSLKYTNIIISTIFLFLIFVLIRTYLKKFLQQSIDF